MTQIILVRHGQTEWNRVERFRGWADVPLNETGLAQAQATGHRIAAEWQPVAIYSSPLSRAMKTAEAIAQHFDLPVQPHQGLIDIQHGEWQGLTPDEVRTRWPELLEAWYTAPHTVRMPEGETLSEVRARGLAVVREVAERHPDETVVLVGHTDINRAILLAVLGLNNTRFWHIRQDTCAINVVETCGDDFVVASLNETYHLRATHG
ncbi:MAG TPA: histidine phosphatase family protein [Anaerolineae bacterium]|nr:histidine phosphatase family protein [Anaerolineae bacterium]